jgi:hypothetical protein
MCRHFSSTLRDPCGSSAAQRLTRRLGALVLALAALPAAWGATLTLMASQPLEAGTGVAAPPWPAGTQWRLDARGLRGPQPLDCLPARQTILLVPAQGLFQGAWQADDAIRAQQKAAALGLAGPQTATLRLDCVNGSFDLHRAAPEGLLTALDGRVLVLRSRPDAADAQAPVRELLLQHLPAHGAFDQEQVVRLRAWLAPSLQGAFTRWFAQPVRQDEAPHLNGDPFTNTQEPPLSLELGLLERRGARATQVVHVDIGGGRRHRLVYRLQRHDKDGWRITDIDYGDGVTLRQLIRQDLQR